MPQTVPASSNAAARSAQLPDWMHASCSDVGDAAHIAWQSTAAAPLGAPHAAAFASQTETHPVKGKAASSGAATASLGPTLLVPLSRSVWDGVASLGSVDAESS
jgi:hypothetical protein